MHLITLLNGMTCHFVVITEKLPPRRCIYVNNRAIAITSVVTPTIRITIRISIIVPIVIAIVTIPFPTIVVIANTLSHQT